MNENDNPFSEDDSYQDQAEKINISDLKMEELEHKIEKYKKIPIVIDSYRSFLVSAIAGEYIGGGTFGGGKLGWNVVKNIEEVIKRTKHNAEVHLRLVAEKRMEPNGDEELAKRILNYKGNLDELFMLVYHASCHKWIEPQLGKYKKLEKRVVKNLSRFLSEYMA